MAELGRRPVPDRLAFMLLGFPPIYFVFNMAFSLYCVPVLRTEQDGGVCNAGKSFALLERFIPAIWRGVNVFTQAGNLRQADVVGTVTQFVWGTALVFAVLIVALAFAWASALGGAEKQRAREIYAKQLAGRGARFEQARQGRYLLSAIFTIVIALAFYGDTAFDDLGSRARDTYVEAGDFLFLIVELSLTLVGVVIVTGNCVRSILLRGASEPDQL